MSTYKFLNLDSENFSNEAKKKLKEKCNYFEENLDQESLYLEIPKYEAIYLRFSVKLDKNILKRAKRLKFILCNATGIDHIDSSYALSQGIKIISLKNQAAYLKNITSSAELTWALLLSLTRNITNAFEDVKKNNWNRNSFIGTQLKNKNIGIIGFGRNGKLVAKYASSFGMNVHFFDSKNFKANLKFKKHKTLKSILNISDFVSIHLPLNKNTKNLFCKKVFKQMKKGSYLINTSRGEIILEQDLIDSLYSDDLRGAAVDVITDETNHKRNLLINYAKKNHNLLITPHIGGATNDSWAATENYVVDRFLEFISLNDK